MWLQRYEDAFLCKGFTSGRQKKLNTQLACFPKHYELPPGKDYSLETNRMIQYLFINRLKPADLIVHVAGAMFEQKQSISEIASEGDNYVIRNKVSKHQAKGPPRPTT